MTARVILLAALLPGTALAQPAPGPAASTAAQEPDYVAIRWWHPVAAMGGLAVLFAVDKPAREFVQDHRSRSTDNAARVAEQFHDPDIFLAAGIAGMAIGLMARDLEIAETGMQVIVTYGLSAGAMIATKWAVGRKRPSSSPDQAMNMHWFEGGATSALPSGAAATTFGLATVLADASGRVYVAVPLYTAAIVNAWSRVNDDKHWVSDVALGALYGITAAKLVNGRWRVSGIRPPTTGVAADGTFRMEWSVPR